MDKTTIDGNKLPDEREIDRILAWTDPRRPQPSDASESHIEVISIREEESRPEIRVPHVIETISSRFQLHDDNVSQSTDDDVVPNTNKSSISARSELTGFPNETLAGCEPSGSTVEHSPTVEESLRRINQTLSDGAVSMQRLQAEWMKLHGTNRVLQETVLTPESVRPTVASPNLVINNTQDRRIILQYLDAVEQSVAGWVTSVQQQFQSTAANRSILHESSERSFVEDTPLPDYQSPQPPMQRDVSRDDYQGRVDQEYPESRPSLRQGRNERMSFRGHVNRSPHSSHRHESSVPETYHGQHNVLHQGLGNERMPPRNTVYNDWRSSQRESSSPREGYHRHDNVFETTCPRPEGRNQGFSTFDPSANSSPREVPIHDYHRPDTGTPLHYESVPSLHEGPYERLSFRDMDPTSLPGSSRRLHIPEGVVQSPHAGDLMQPVMANLQRDQAQRRTQGRYEHPMYPSEDDDIHVSNGRLFCESCHRRQFIPSPERVLNDSLQRNVSTVRGTPDTYPVTTATAESQPETGHVPEATAAGRPVQPESAEMPAAGNAISPPRRPTTNNPSVPVAPHLVYSRSRDPPELRSIINNNMSSFFTRPDPPPCVTHQQQYHGTTNTVEENGIPMSSFAADFYVTAEESIFNALIAQTWSNILFPTHLEVRQVDIPPIPNLREIREEEKNKWTNTMLHPTPGSSVATREMASSEGSVPSGNNHLEKTTTKSHEESNRNTSGVGDGNTATVVEIEEMSNTEKRKHPSEIVLDTTYATGSSDSTTARLPKVSNEIHTTPLLADVERNTNFLSSEPLVATATGRHHLNEVMNQSSVEDDDTSNGNSVNIVARQDGTTIVSAQLVDESELEVLNHLRQLRVDMVQVVEYQQSQEEERRQRRRGWTRWLQKLGCLIPSHHVHSVTA